MWERRMIEVVTFDVYGTLVDWVYSIKNFVSKYISPGAVDDYFRCDIEEVRLYRPYKEILRTCLRKTAERHGVEIDRDLLDVFVIHFARSPFFPDSLYGLRVLRRMGLRTGVISNTDRDLIEITLSGARDLFDYVVTAEDTGYYKPDPRAFTRALEIIGVERDRVLHVSSYPQYDLDTAKSLGLRAVHLNRYGYEWRPEIDSLEKLPDMIRWLERGP